jgi:endo-1,4-beta-xylanase
MWKERQCEGVVRLIQNLKSKGVCIDGLGIQGHWGLDYPSFKQIETFIGALSKLGVKLMITEMDLSVLPYAEDYMGAKLSSLDPGLQKKFNPYTDALPNSVQKDLANRYAELFSFFRKHRDKFNRVTVWGVHDGQSWRNDWPVIGRTDYPMLFDRHFKTKPAFDAVVKVVQSKKLRTQTDRLNNILGECQYV